MDFSQIQPVIEQVLISIYNYAPDAKEHIASILEAVQSGKIVVAALSTLIVKVPNLPELVNQFIVLVRSGAGVYEIASTLTELATNLGISAESLLQLLAIFAGLL